MKKPIAAITVITAVLILAVAGCNKQQIPAAPYDATPTATYNITVDVLVQDADSSMNTTPAQGVDVRLHYPDSSGRYEEGNTGNSGTARIMVHSYGTYQVELMPNTFNGYSNSIFDTVDVRAGYTEKTITRYQPIGFTFVTPTNTNYDKNGGTYTMTIKYSTLTPRTIALAVTTNATSEIQYWFDPVSSTTNNNDTVYFHVYVPTYYQIPGNQLQFKTTGVDATNKVLLYYTFVLNQTWSFDINTSQFHGLLYGGGRGTTPYTGIVLWDFSFYTNNITEPGDVKVELESMKYFSNGKWMDHTYWGGLFTPQIKVGGGPYTPTELPLIMPVTGLFNRLSLEYDWGFTLPSFISVQATLKITWGNLVYRKTYTTTDAGEWYK
jgi:hypothetical protein